MKLIRFGEIGRESTGDGLSDLRRWLKENDSAAPRIGGEVRPGPPICRPSKIVCIGLNFRDHAVEAGMQIPNEPVLFFKINDVAGWPRR